MFSLYKPNFCSDCGVKLSKDNWRWKQKFLPSCYFCINCARRLEPLIRKKYISLGLSFIFLAFLLKSYIFNTTVPTIIEPKAIPAPILSTVNSSININKPSKDEVVCGAKTLKGKKCKRRVKAVGYCWQHKNLVKLNSWQK